MYDLNDTIVAISSPPSGARAIVRLTGPKTVKVCEQLFCTPINPQKSGISAGRVTIEAELKVDAKLYLFLAPHSYTGDDVAEIHLNTNRSVTEALMDSLLGSRKLVLSRVEGAGSGSHAVGSRSLSTGCRMAGPGEFTARAYLNSKIDLAQAEAVNEIVVSSNRYQLAAAEKLLSGRLAETTKKMCSEIMDCLSLIEAGLDFSSEDIEFISPEKAVARLAEIKDQLERLLSASIRYESVIDLPAVGIAGAPNAGKSSLLNKLLGQERSIISDQRKTTRDVLTGELLLAHCKCVLFDCAGLTSDTSNESILDELAQQVAIEALRNSSVVVFCVDISKINWAEDMSVYRAIRSKLEIPLAKPAVIPVATKADLLTQKLLADRIDRLDELFSVEFLPVSVKSGAGLNQLADIIDRKIIELATGSKEKQTGYKLQDTRYEIILTARHRQAVNETIGHISEVINELKAGYDEVAAMMLRAAYQILSNIEAEHIDEQILERIFSRFCIGK